MTSVGTEGSYGKATFLSYFLDNPAFRGVLKPEMKIDRISKSSAEEEGEGPIEVLKEYSQETTLHGIRYVLKEGTPLQVRLCWAVALLLCAGFASWFVHSAWFEFQHSPTETRVLATHYPLYNVPFPAVTVCSSTRVMRRWGESRLVRFLKPDPYPLPSQTRQEYRNIMSAFALLQYPMLEEMKKPLETAQKYYDALEDFNVTWYMMEVLPRCNQVFEKCFWRGVSFNCCDVFKLQRSELGFCYSFNSLTSEHTKHCPWAGAEERLEGIDHVSYKGNPKCTLRRNTGFGTSTGLQVKLKAHPWVDTLPGGQRDSSGNRILVHHPAEFPEASMGLLMPQDDGMIYTVRVSASVSYSTEAVRELPPEKRYCYFPDEKKLTIASMYTQRTCLIECRLQYIIKKCGCIPYYFWEPEGNITQCSLSKLNCIADLNEYLRTFAAPSYINGLDDIAAINCSHCLPTCQETNYVLDIGLHQDKNASYVGRFSFLDVYYKSWGGVVYKTDLAFGRMQLIVSFGGIVGLFLGVSILSGVELVFYSTKLFTAILGYIVSRLNCRHTQKLQTEAVAARYQYDNYFQQKKELPPITIHF